MNGMRALTKSVLILALITAGALSSIGAIATTSQSFDGRYSWSSGGSDRLSAEFTPDGDGAWKVRFDFRFDNKDNTWYGTAKGDLEEGAEVSGTTRWRGRTWTFDAHIDEGVMYGTHVEIRGRKERRSGTFEMSWRQ